MPRDYSTYEAKAKFSELIRAVRAGQRILIRYHGRPVAELRPIEPGRVGLEDRIAELERAGVLSEPAAPARVLRAIVRRPGALRRFLDERD